MQLSKRSKAVVEAYNRGFRIDNGVIYNPDNEIVKGSIRETNNKKKIPYLEFSIKLDNEIIHIRAHRLVAYQKYGDKIFEPGIQVRHLDSNSLNNLDDNIAIGSNRDNMMDKPKEVRFKCAIKASYTNRTFTDEQVKQIKIDRASGMKYKELCAKYNTSGSVLSYLFNKALYAN